MTNAYVLSLNAIIGLSFALISQLTSATTIYETSPKVLTIYLDKNWKNIEIENEIQQKEQELSVAHNELDLLKKESDELYVQLMSMRNYIRDLAVNGSYQEITEARENYQIKKQIMKQKKEEIAKASQVLKTKENDRTLLIDEYHSSILTAAENDLPAYIDFIRKSKDELFENNKEAWALLDYNVLQKICLNLSPNYHLRNSEKKIYSGVNDHHELRYKSLFVGWNAHLSFHENRSKSEKNVDQNGYVFLSAQSISGISVHAKRLDDLWRNTYVEPRWNNLNVSQKISKSSLKSYTYSFYKTYIAFMKSIEDSLTSKGDYDFTQAFTVLALPILAPVAAVGFVALFPSVPLHFTEASLRFVGQEAICRISRKKIITLINDLLPFLKNRGHTVAHIYNK
ncbi:hypothetical protein Noda2021_03490 [Candidatus Dependentiae bacterium Noda2021]|nr:hypothetical protein Noda2021_03490 [Candidatus Dependentiae bacterium Noda2021]